MSELLAVQTESPASFLSGGTSTAKHPKTVVFAGLTVVLLVSTFILAGVYFAVIKDTGQTQDSAMREIVPVNTKSVVSVDERELSAEPELTVESIKGLLQKWEKAQDEQNFAAYQTCYTAPFRGIKTTVTGESVYDYSGWMADRRKMFKNAAGLDVEIRNLQISIGGDSASVVFD